MHSNCRPWVSSPLKSSRVEVPSAGGSGMSCSRVTDMSDGLRGIALLGKGEWKGAIFDCAVRAGIARTPTNHTRAVPEDKGT